MVLFMLWVIIIIVLFKFVWIFISVFCKCVCVSVLSVLKGLFISNILGCIDSVLVILIFCFMLLEILLGNLFKVWVIWMSLRLCMI